MKTLASLLLSATLAPCALHAQVSASVTVTASAGALHIPTALMHALGTALNTELGADRNGPARITCSITDYNEGGSGTGAGLVMYSGARHHLGLTVLLIDVRSGRTVRQARIQLRSRAGQDDLVKQVVEAVAEQAEGYQWQVTELEVEEDVVGRGW